MQVRISLQEAELIERARGRRSMSIWLREAIKDKIARETGTRL